MTSSGKVLFRHYGTVLKKSGTRVPLIEVRSGLVIGDWFYRRSPVAPVGGGSGRCRVLQWGGAAANGGLDGGLAVCVGVLVFQKGR